MFSFANANVLLVLGELMGGEAEDGVPSRSAIPLVGGAIVLAQLTMVRYMLILLCYVCNQTSIHGPLTFFHLYEFCNRLLQLGLEIDSLSKGLDGNHYF